MRVPIPEKHYGNLLLREPPHFERGRAYLRPRTLNRMSAMRLRDTYRWVYRYRQVAEEEAFRLAQERSFLSRLTHLVQGVMHILTASKGRLP